MKKFSQKSVAVIINPIAASDMPVLALLNQAFVRHGIQWNAHIVNKGEDVRKRTQQVLRTKPDVVYVLGGDGTVCEVLEGMGKNSTPVALLPGGTANILAKELGISQDLTEAVQGFAASKGESAKITTCLQGKDPFFLRLSVGVLADMVAHSSRKQKEQLGLLAYPLSALASWQQSTSQTFHLHIDGKSIEAEGVSLVINNCGNIGLPGVSFLPNIDATDEYLDVIVIQAQDVPSLLSVAKTTLADKSPSPLLQHWRAKKVEVRLEKKSLVLHDDEQQAAQRFTAQTTQQKIVCLLPASR